jgi:hypothetical protein
MFRRSRSLVWAGAIATVTVGMGAGLGSPTAASAISQRHCITKPSASRAPSMVCFTTFAQAIFAASDGRVVLDPGAPVGLLPAAAQITNALGSLSPLATVIIGVDYTGTSYSGSSLTWYESAGCGSYLTSSMPTGWNDVISSVANYSGCGTSLYQNINYGGSKSSVGVDDAASTLGSFNGQASSQKWCTSSSC